MAAEYTAEAATVEEALDFALEQLGVQQDAVDYEIIEEASKKHFGFGADRLAKVRVVVKESFSVSGDAGETSEAVHSSQIDNKIDSEDLSDEQIDEIADSAIAVVRKIAAYCGAEGFEINEYEGEDGEIVLDLVGENLAFLIGRHGRTVDALQTATSAIVTKEIGIRYPITVDVEGYKHRRKQKVIEIAQHAAERAKRTGYPVDLRPMSPQERRIVHIAIRELVGVESSSSGIGDERHVVVKTIS
ncbi:MAG: Jag N-terminal domain-containing protein [Coriobacteriia bacterium]|nr:Jag N-terminal domain-containing protein [Coriobacteriia bacterium]